MEKEEKELTLLEFIKILFGRKIVILISILVSIIVIFLSVQFGINKIRSKYVSNFSYDSVDLVGNQYVDGTQFDYQSLLKLEVYEEIKKSNDNLSSLDIQRLIDDNAITINSERVKIEGTENYTNFYNLNVSSKYFNNASIAKTFIEELSSYPVNKNISLVKKLNYSSYLNSYLYANSYEDKVEYLKKQYLYLLTNYQNLNIKYGEVYVDGVLLSSYLDELNISFTDNSFEFLENEISSGGYVLKESTSLSELQVEYNALTFKKKENEAKIKSLQDQIQFLIDKVGASNISSINLDSYNEKISELLIENTEIQSEIDLKLSKIENYNNETQEYLEKVTIFENMLKLYYEKLTKYTDIYSRVQQSLVSNSNVKYEYSSVIVSTGNINIVITLLAGLIFGLFVGCIINLCLGKEKFFKKKEDNTIISE